MANEHHYALELRWQGDHTRSYTSYTRAHRIQIAGKPELIATADPTFLGDASQHNPEDLLLAALSGCHLLTYLALCARARIDVTRYTDKATGTLVTTSDGGGRFSEVILRPDVVVTEGPMLEKARHFHGEVHKYCFIARSVNFPVRCEPSVRLA